MRYYLIAGEASGDMHASNLMRALREEDGSALFRFWGGDCMAAVAEQAPVRHIRELSYMGFWEVARHIRTLLRLQREAKQDVRDWQPDALILIDYPGFNLPLAKAAKALGIRVFWYIAPQVWAWKARRVKVLRERVERLYAILPFEQAFFAQHGMDIEYVGHPLLDVVQRDGQQTPLFGGETAEKLWIALLPGSRRQEVLRLLPTMLAVAESTPQETFVLAAVDHLDDSVYGSDQLPTNVRIVRNDTYRVLEGAKAALVTSGTATLETALFGVPQVVLYKSSAVSVWLARRLINVAYIALPNLILDRPLIPEMIQDQAMPAPVSTRLQGLLQAGKDRDDMMAGYAELRGLLGGKGASKRVAQDIHTRLLKRP